MDNKIPLPAILLGLVIAALIIYFKPDKPKKPPIKINLPSSEQVGEGAGKVSKGFTKGFVKGLFNKEKVDGKETDAGMGGDR